MPFADQHRNRELYSARFRGGQDESLVRSVARRMLQIGGNPYIVDTDEDGLDFGDATTLGLYYMYVLIAFVQDSHPYGEKTNNPHCSFFELKEALEQEVPILYVILGKSPPEPVNELAKAMKSRTFSQGKFKLYLGGELDPDVIARKIMQQVTVLRKIKQDAGTWFYSATAAGAKNGVPRAITSASAHAPAQTAKTAPAKTHSAFAPAKTAKTAAAEVCKKDRDIWMVAVRIDGRKLKDAPEDLKKDRSVVLAAVRQNGDALRHVHEDLKKDRDVVLAAVAQNGNALYHAHKDLKKDRDVVLAAVKTNRDREGPFGEGPPMALNSAHKDLKKDRDFMLAAVTIKGMGLYFAHADFLKDRGIVMAAVTQDGAALYYAHEDLTKDRVIVMAAVGNCGEALRFAHEDVKKNRDVVLAAVKTNGEALKWAHEDLQKDRELRKLAGWPKLGWFR